QRCERERLSNHDRTPPISRRQTCAYGAWSASQPKPHHPWGRPPAQTNGETPPRTQEHSPQHQSSGCGTQASGSRLNLGEGRQISNAPAVHNLSAERDLVVALQVALTVRVAVADDLQADGLLNAPANCGEVANEGVNAGSALVHAKV